MSFISFVFYKSYYYFIIYWIVDSIITLGKDYFETQPSVKGSRFAKEIDLFYLICLNISDLSAGFLVLFTYFKLKTLRKNRPIDKAIIRTSVNSLELIYNDYSIRENKYPLILLISILDLLGRSTSFIFNLFVDSEKLNIKETNWLISIDIISRVIFSRLILKTKLYKHHILSIAIIVIGFIPMMTYGIIDINEKNDWIHILFLFPQNIIFGFSDSIIKILLTNKFVLPHYLMFYRGIINFGMYLIIIPILCVTNSINFDYFKTIDKLGLKIFMRFILIIFSLLKSLCVMKIIYTFTPFHVAFVNSALVLIQLIKYIISEGGLDIIILIISLLIIILGILIFNEIIILNFCQLNEDTKKEILLREQKEILNIDAPIELNIDLDNNDNNENNISNI